MLTLLYIKKEIQSVVTRAILCCICCIGILGFCTLMYKKGEAIPHCLGISLFGIILLLLVVPPPPRPLPFLGFAPGGAAR